MSSGDESEPKTGKKYENETESSKYSDSSKRDEDRTTKYGAVQGKTPKSGKSDKSDKKKNKSEDANTPGQ